MAEDIPRRLQRFYRGQGENESGKATHAEKGMAESLFQQIPREKKKGKMGKELAKHLALQEVKKFKAKHKRYPKKQEYEDIAESIYQQLHDAEERERLAEKLSRQKERKERKGERRKGKERGRRGRGRHRKQEGKEEEGEKPEEKPESQELPEGKAQQAQAKAEELGNLSISDVFGEKKKGTAAPGSESEDEFSLSGLSLGGGEEAEEEKCPRCGKPGKAVFCPSCGTAFCSKCAKGKEKTGKKVSLICPECGKKVSQ